MTCIRQDLTGHCDHLQCPYPTLSGWECEHKQNLSNHRQRADTEEEIMIELNLAAGVLTAMAATTSPRLGKTDPNPNSAIHLRYYDETAIRMASTNGRQIAWLRLEKGTDQFEECYWPDEEREQIVSIVLNAQALAAVAKMGNRVILSISHLFAKLRSVGDSISTSIEVPRIHGRQISLWDDMDSIKAVTHDDLTPRGQLLVQPKILSGLSKMAKLIGIPEPSNLAIAQIGTSYGVTFGSDETFFVLTPCDTTIPAMGAGMPPWWVTGQQGARSLVDASDDLFMHVVDPEEDTEQVQLAFSDEHGPAVMPGENELDALIDEHQEGGDDRFILDNLPVIDA